MRLLVLLAVALTSLWAQDPYAIVRRAVELDAQAPQFPSDFAFDKRVATTSLDKNAKPSGTKVADFEVIMLLGQPVERVVARDGKSLEPQYLAKERVGFDKAFAQAATLTEQQRLAKTLEAERKDRKQREFLKALPNVYELTLAGQDVIDGRAAYRIDAKPRKGAKLPGFGPKRTFFKLYGSMWIDVESNQWVKVDTVVNDTLSWGLFLARIQPGSRILFERRLLGDLWVPTRIGGRFVARFFGFKGFALEQETTFTNYRRFRTESRIEDVREVNP